MREDRLSAFTGTCLEEAIVSHVITCQGRDHFVNIQSGQHSLVIVNVHFEPELTSRQLRGRLGTIHSTLAWHIPVVWALRWGDYNICDPEGRLNVWNHSFTDGDPGKHFLCSILSFHTSLRLPNLITPGETPRPLVSYALF